MLLSLGRPVLSSVHLECSSGWARPRDGGTRLHRSTDYPLVEGTSIRAVAGGRVIHADAVDNSAAGKWVAVRHRYGLVSRYMHLSTLSVQVGDDVGKGAELGKSGNTGSSEGPHLHLNLCVPDELLDDITRAVGKPASGYGAPIWNDLYAIPAEPWIPVDEYRAIVRTEAAEQGIPLYRWRPPDGLVVAGVALGVAAAARILLG